MSKGKRYEKSFQLQAHGLLRTTVPLEQAGARLGVSAWSVRSWLNQFRASGELPGKDSPAPTADELKALREENRKLRLENDILKKATAYFAKDSL